MKRIIILFLLIFCGAKGYSQDKNTLSDYSYLIFKTPIFISTDNIGSIYSSHRNVRIDWGTCFFIRAKDRLFLVTASHVVDKVQSQLFAPNALTDLYKRNQWITGIPSNVVDTQTPNNLPVGKEQSFNFSFSTPQTKVDSQFLELSNFAASQVPPQHEDDKTIAQPTLSLVFDGSHIRVDSQYLASSNLPLSAFNGDISDPDFHLFRDSSPLGNIPFKIDGQNLLVGINQPSNLNLDSLLKNISKSDSFQFNPNSRSLYGSNPNFYSGEPLMALEDETEYLELRYYDSATKGYEFCQIKYDPQTSYGFDTSHPDVRIIEVKGLPKTAVINSIEKLLPKQKNKPKDEAFFWGFPQNNQQTLFAIPLSPQQFFSQSPTLYNGRLEDFAHNYPVDVDRFYYVLTPQTFKGASGSPIFFISNKGKYQDIEFAGVQSAINSQFNTTYLVRADEVIQMINDELKN
ncbi:MAG TPA: hypothetical protein VHB54_11585 [Mucilaginibacter sp.]|nr:hypothetical protein [Mucilaginibacter sp.]